jgi:hypothetical protein
MVVFSTERRELPVIDPICRVCRRGGAMPTVLRADSRVFMGLFPMDFWIDALCDPCWLVVIGVGKAARKNALGTYDDSAQDEGRSR